MKHYQKESDKLGFDFEWIACALDTEGSLSMAHRLRKSQRSTEQYSPRVEIVNTSKKWLEYCAFKMHVSKPIFTLRKATKCFGYQGWKELYVLYVPQSWLRENIDKLIPYLIIKKEQGKILLRWFQLRPGYKGKRTPPYQPEIKELYKKMRLLNNRRHDLDNQP